MTNASGAAIEGWIASLRSNRLHDGTELPRRDAGVGWLLRMRLAIHYYPSLLAFLDNRS